MGLMICKNVGCELTFCQATMSDPYERPFENCEAQFKTLNSCINQEVRRYQFDSQGRSMKEQILLRLEQKKRENDLLMKDLYQTDENVRKYYFKEAMKITENKL